MMPASVSAARGSRLRDLCIGCVVALAGCAAIPPAAPGVSGKPIGEFFDELKAELRDVHWRVRSDRAACGTPEPREVDLRNATITLELSRIGEASVDGEVKLVALPLGGIALTPLGSASASRKWTQEIVLKLDVAGPSKLYTPGQATGTSGEVARTINAAIDGFVRSSADEPCVRLSSLKLSLVIDVRREAGGGFRLAVPAVDAGVETSRRDVNTLTLSWDKVLSNALR